MAASLQNDAAHAGHARVFKALGNPLRHEIVHRLLGGPKQVTQIAEECGTSVSNASQHLSRLEALGLVEARREGRNVWFSLSHPELADACAIIGRILDQRALAMAASVRVSSIRGEGDSDAQE